MVQCIINTFLLIANLLVPSFDGPDAKIVVEKLAQYSWTHPQEKVYLHTDKTFYIPGDDIWFKAYLMIGPYQIPDTISGVLYVELIDNDALIVDRKTLHMRFGLGWGDFHLPQTIKPGRYILKAYTRYMQNFDPDFHYRKSINVVADLQSEISNQGNKYERPSQTTEPINNNPIHIQFFPEGGNLVEELQSVVAFKVTDRGGNGKHVSGIVKNGQGEQITTFESRKFGLGTFSIKPESGQKYIAAIMVDNMEYQFPLPDPLKKGYVMHISQKGKNVYIWVKNNMAIKMDSSFVIGQFRGFPFITIKSKQAGDFLYSVLNTSEIPSGIIQFTFFDSLGIPQCERLVYTENESNTLNLSIESNKKTYRKREEVQFDIHSEDMSGNYPLTNVSLSITNTALVNKDENKSHIRSYFNLESDLKGYIEDPGYFFNPDNEDRFELLDMLMLTHGWRRFVWEEVLENEFPEISYSAELGFNFEGRVFDNYNQSRPGTGTVRLFIFEGQFYYNEVDTDENGFFHFLGIDIYDSTEVVMQAWKESEGGRQKKRQKAPESEKKLAIKIDQKPLADVRPELWPDMKNTEKDDHQEYIDLKDMILRIDSAYDEKTILLEEVVIKDKMILDNDPFNRPGKLHKNYIRRVVMDSIPVSEQSLLFFDLIRKYYPNVKVTGMPPEVTVLIRGNRSLLGSENAMLLLDGLSVTSDFLYYFPVSEIAFFDVLSSVGASIYGQGSMNGAIAIYTRNEPAPIKVAEGRDWVLNFVQAGYQRGREFYTPDYGQPEEAHIKPDFRKVLYWNPSLTTDDLGNISFSFYTSDEIAEYRVELEGMTYDGIPVTKLYYFSVK